MGEEVTAAGRDVGEEILEGVVLVSGDAHLDHRSALVRRQRLSGHDRDRDGGLFRLGHLVTVGDADG